MRHVKGLLVAAVAGAAAVVLSPASPASAHTATFDRDCDNVVVKLTQFKQSTETDKNIVKIYRDGVEIKTIEFTGKGAEEKFAEAHTTGVHVYEAKWTKTGSDDHSGASGKESLSAPKRCGIVKPSHSKTPCPTPTKPTPTKSTSPSPSTSPSKSVSPSVPPVTSKPPVTHPPVTSKPPVVPPVVSTPSPSQSKSPTPLPTKAGNDSGLPVTGTGGLVATLTIGLVLLAGGAAAVIFARRRRAQA